MENIRLKKITVAPLQSPLVIHNGNVHFYDTSESLNVLSGSIIADGGVSINCSYNATSPSAGGALTIGGGIGVAKDVFIGKNLTLNSIDGVLSVKGISKNRLYLDSVLNKEFYISLDGVNTKLLLRDDNMSLYTTSPSNNSTSGALWVKGGVSISCSDNALSITQGGALTVIGGIATESDFRVGGNIHTNGYVSAGSFRSSNATIGTMTVTTQLAADGRVTATNSSNTLGNMFTTGGNVGINNVSPTESLDIKGNLAIGNNTQSNYIAFNATYQNGFVGERYYTGTSGSELLLANGDDINASRIRLLAPEHRFDTFTQSSSNFNTFDTMGSNGMTRMVISSNGNIGIGTTSPQQLLTVNGMISSSSLSTQQVTIGQLTTSNITSSNIDVGSLSSTNVNVTNQTCSNAVFINTTSTGLTSGSINATNLVSTNITASSLNSALIVSNNITTGSLTVSGGSLNAVNNANTVGNIYTTGGNVGIANATPGAVLDVTGTFNCSNTATFTGNIPSSNSSTASLVLTRGGVSINNTENSSSVSNGGALTVAGGAAIAKNVNIGGVTTITSTQTSTSASVGALTINGGLSINNNANSSSITSGGALTIRGGVGIEKDMYIGGSLSCNSSASFASVLVISTSDSTSSSNGSFVSNGGVGISKTTNSSSVSQGGSLTLAGGCAIGKDVYIGGDVHTYGATNLFGSTVINIKNGVSGNTVFSLERSGVDISLRRIDTTAQNVLTIFNTSGSVTLFGTSPSFSSSASLLMQGGLSIMNTSNATNLSSGGAITLEGGASVRKDLLVGGSITIFSTTQSSNVSTGCLVLRGGLGISGNAHILGDAVVNGNLTVNGSTLSVTSITTTLSDNIMMLNSGPSGSADAGIMLQRFQQDNDTGAGDVVADSSRYESITLPSQASMSGNQIQLSTGASASNNYYNGWWIKVTSGLSNNQVRKITSYNGTTKVATISSAWTSQNPGLGDIVYIYNKPYVGIIYNELTDRFVFGSTVEDPGRSNVTFTDTIPVQALSIALTSSQHSSSSSVGSIITSGGITIQNTTDAQSPTNGGTLTTLGGIGVRKSVRVGEGLYIDGSTLKLPVGNTLQKPTSPATGFLYLDTDANDVQVYINSQWTSILATTSLSSLDGKTKMAVESSLGNGDNNIVLVTNNTERLRVSTSGNIGIGTTAPSANLHVNGSCLFSSTTNSVGIGSGGNLTVLGGASFSKDVYVGGTITSSSDERLKEDIKNIVNASDAKILDKVDKLRCVKYKYKNDPEETNHIGFIAQDFVDDFPELLRKPEGGYYSLDYSKVTVLLVECVKELKKEIKRLKCSLIRSVMDNDIFDTSDL